MKHCLVFSKFHSLDTDTLCLTHYSLIYSVSVPVFLVDVLVGVWCEYRTMLFELR